jgi:putative hydrolase of the HAD superfamily
MVRAVLFDLDDTLFDHAACSRDALEAVQGCHAGLHAMAFAELERAHSEFLELLHVDVMVGRMPLDVARRERFRRLFNRAGVRPDAALVATTAETYRNRYREVWRAVPGAARLLALVRERARVAIVSNNLRVEPREKLRVCGLEPFVDALVVSEEIGVPKPDPAIFDAALQRVACGPDEAVMVGDSWAADIVGARAAGIRAIWFNPRGTPAPEEGSTQAQVQTFEPPGPAVRLIFGEE